MASNSLFPYSLLQISFFSPAKQKPFQTSNPSILPLSSHSFSPLSAHTNQQNPFKEGRTRDSKPPQNDPYDDLLTGDCLVFEQGAFEPAFPRKRFSNSDAKSAGDSSDLIPDKWKEVVAEINLTKKEKRKIAHQIRFGSRLSPRKKTLEPDEEYLAYREIKLSQLNPVVLDSPKRFPAARKELGEGSSGRVVARNPRLGIQKETMEDITEFFSSGDYVPGERIDDKKPQGRRKLFTEEEKVLLNKRIPNLVEATSRKWLPLHTLTSSGEFYLLDLLLKHNVDINAVDEDGLTAIHKAIISKKHAITSYLLRNSANPFVRDMDDATLMHYAVHTASSDTIKILMLYSVDINLADNDGWTPLHLAVHAQRTDIVRLLLKKGADRTLKNKDGLRPLDLCLYCGHNVRTYEIIKLLHEVPRPEPHG